MSSGPFKIGLNETQLGIAAPLWFAETMTVCSQKAMLACCTHVLISATAGARRSASDRKAFAGLNLHRLFVFHGVFQILAFVNRLQRAAPQLFFSWAAC
jgi:hypothetical protein